MKRTSWLLFILQVVVFFLSCQEKYIPDPELIKKWKAYVLPPDRITQYTDGEDLCWFGSPFLRGMVAMAEATGDTEPLDSLCQRFEYLMSITTYDIDSLYGWPTTHGGYGRHGPRCIIMNDGHLAEPLVSFALLLRKEKHLQEKYGDKVEKYLAFFDQKIWPKWEASWQDLADSVVTVRYINQQQERVSARLPEPGGVYCFFGPGRKKGMSLPLNQFLSVARLFIPFHELTGNDRYLRKVRRMAVTAKHVYLGNSAARYSDLSEHYDPWCYWQPVYPGDYKRNGKPVHWVNPHPYRTSYANLEVGVFTQLHRKGIIFTDADMDKLVRLHLEVQWNKSWEKPRFDYLNQIWRKTYPSSLWGSLAYYDRTIRKLTEQQTGHRDIDSLAGYWGGIEGVPRYIMGKKKED